MLYLYRYVWFRTDTWWIMMTFWQHVFKSHEAIAQDDDDDDVDPASCWLIEVHVTSSMVKLHRIYAYNRYGVYIYVIYSQLVMIYGWWSSHHHWGTNCNRHTNPHENGLVAFLQSGYLIQLTWLWHTWKWKCSCNCKWGQVSKKNQRCKHLIVQTS